MSFVRASALCLLLMPAGLIGGAIRLKTRVVENLGQPDVSRPVKRETLGRSHYLLQFDGYPGAEVITSLVERGATVLGYIPDSGLMVSAGDDLVWEGLPVSGAGRLAKEDKLSPLVLGSAGGAFVVEFHGDVDPGLARKLVEDRGLQILEHPDLLPEQLLVTGAFEKISELAEWDEVAYIFPASAELIAGERVTACAGAVTLAGPIGQYVKAAPAWSSDGSGGVELRYVFSSLTQKLPTTAAEGEILRAFREWAKYAKLSFAPGDSASAARTIAVLFARGPHGDPYPFDASGRILAHTFYPSPPNPEPVAGDMHLNDDEDWHVGAAIDLYTVALHEAGHALGLGHSDQPGAVMYPYYHPAAGLTDDDIAGIRDLYPSRDNPGIQPPRPVLTLTIEDPASPYTTTTAASILISGRVENASGTAQVSWHAEQGRSGSAAGSPRWSVAAVPLDQGPNAITIAALDTSGASALGTITVMRQNSLATPPSGGDTTPPLLRILSPPVTILSTSASSITLRGIASDDIGVVEVTWSNSTGGLGRAAGTTDWVASDIALLEGTNTITIQAFDAAGNSSWRAVTVVRR